MYCSLDRAEEVPEVLNEDNFAPGRDVKLGYSILTICNSLILIVS
jgi:hypothetical protein